MNVLHVVPSYYPATYFGGPIYSTLGLCDALQAIEGVHLRVLTTDTAGPALTDKIPLANNPVIFPAGYSVDYCSRVFGSSFSWALLRRLKQSVEWADIVHLTGVYSSTTIPTLLACRLLDRPVVWSPRGSLQRWKGATNTLLKQVWETTCNCLITEGRVALHVTSEQEAQSSSARIPKAFSRLIRNGVEIPPFAAHRTWCPEGKLRLMYMGRLHPIKGLENLLQALANSTHDDIELTICGTGAPGYLCTLQSLANELRILHRTHFVGEVHADQKSTAFNAADVCILPSHSENFGMTIVESLAYGVPVIASTGTPWAELETRRCGRWVPNDAQSISDTLQQIKGQDLPNMGVRGRMWVTQEYGWQNIADEMHDLYSHLQRRQAMQ